MRALILTSVIVFAAACAPRERVIVIKEQSTTNSALKGGHDGAFVASGGPRHVGGEPDEWGIKSPSDRAEYARVIEKVTSMVSDSDLRRRVGRRNLTVVNVAWEDTGRAQGSALGPNISDLSLQVRRRDELGQPQASIMPVIRQPNFSDRTGDIPADRFFVRVGNEQRADGLRSVPLTDVLKDLRAFAARPGSILGSGNMLAPRDTHFLVSAQAVFLPIPKSGKAEFNPVVFNYQSAPGSPAVLTLLVTRQGTSMQVIENRGDDVTAAGWGQELYFNDRGSRSAFTAERKSDVEQRIAAQGGPKSEDDVSALQKGADMLFLVQVPLKHRNAGRLGGLGQAAPTAKGWGGGAPLPEPPSAAAEASAMNDGARRARSDVENAVLGHGPNVGPYNEGRGLRLERDPRFPIRITVQFYKATSNGVVSDVDLDSIAKSIGSVYEHADFVGSLVLPENDPRRPTAWQKVPRAWFPW